MPDHRTGNQATKTNVGPGWWVIIVGFLMGAALPLMSRTARRQMFSGELPFEMMIGTGVIGAAAAALLLMQERIKNPTLRTFVMCVGVLVIVVGVGMALIMMME